jgi:hypothetical protein
MTDSSWHSGHFHFGSLFINFSSSARLKAKIIYIISKATSCTYVKGLSTNDASGIIRHWALSWPEDHAAWIINLQTGHLASGVSVRWQVLVTFFTTLASIFSFSVHRNVISLCSVKSQGFPKYLVFLDIFRRARRCALLSPGGHPCALLPPRGRPATCLVIYDTNSIREPPKVS